MHEEEWGIISCPEKRTASLERRIGSGAPPGAPNPVKLRQTYSRDAFGDVPNLSIENATKCVRIESYGVDNRNRLSGGVGK